MTRIALTENTTLYISPSGSDSNDGSTPTLAFKTRQAAYHYAQANLDLAGFILTFQLADGTYTDGMNVKGPLVGGTSPDTVIFQGNLTYPAACVISAPDCFSAVYAAMFSIRGFRLQGGAGIESGPLAVIVFGNIDFGQCSGPHMNAYLAGQIITDGTPYSISGGANSHFKGDSYGIINVSGITITLNGTPAFNCFSANGAALVCNAGLGFAGSGATGARYSVIENGITVVYNGNPNYYPGSWGGSSGSGGLLV
jgi:hypothetical protein